MTVVIVNRTEQLLAEWREAQRVVDHLRLDAPSRFEAENRLHDARAAYQWHINELEDAERGDAI